MKVSEYLEAEDCRGKDCLFADVCIVMSSIWGMNGHQDPFCVGLDPDEEVDVVLERIGRARLREDEEDDKKRATTERKAETQRKRRATLLKNRVKNRERAKSRKEAREKLKRKQDAEAATAVSDILRRLF